MKILLFVFFVALFCRGDTVNPRSINLNLDTSFVVDHADDDKMTLLEKVKKVFDKIREFFETLNVDEIVSKKKEKISDAIDDKRFLKAFLKKIGKTALEYDNSILKNLAKCVADEISKIVEQNEEFSDIDFKKMIDKKVKILSSMRPKKIKSAIKRALKAKSERIQNLDKKFRDFYDERDRGKLKRLITRFEEKPESNKKLKKIVKDAFSVLFYEKYDKLDKSVRKLFTKEIKELFFIVDLGIHTRRMNDDDKSSDFEIEINPGNTNNSSKETNKISFKKDIEIVVNGKNSEEADT